ncbi:MAG: DUF370 domain-containing protein [Oscillospiraceae bacterium]|nr:DUF370 domain-containing protein [Oscillospiraceae bacterium]
MNLHIGDQSIPPKDILGLFDLDAITMEKSTRDTLNKAQANGLLRDFCAGELPRSLVLAVDKAQQAWYYLAAPNTATLRKRMRVAL